MESAFLLWFIAWLLSYPKVFSEEISGWVSVCNFQSKDVYKQTTSNVWALIKDHPVVVFFQAEVQQPQHSLGEHRNRGPEA